MYCKDPKTGVDFLIQRSRHIFANDSSGRLEQLPSRSQFEGSNPSIRSNLHKFTYWVSPVISADMIVEILKGRAGDT